MYDVIIVGARCAGASTALLLARKGYKVLVVDRATFPSDSMRNHYILYRGILALKRWGLLEAIHASNCPPIRKKLSNFGDFSLVGHPPLIEGAAGEYAPRRIVLDNILIKAAVEAGAELREGLVVEQILADETGVTGIQGRTRSSTVVGAQARIVIGADGLHSLVARTGRAQMYRNRPALTCAYYSYWSGIQSEAQELYILQDAPAMIFSFPTNDGLTCVAIQWPVERFNTIRGAIDTHFMKTLDRVPELASRVREGTREANFLGTADLPNFFRKPYGPGWALVGDAGYHKDPFRASGISDAFRDAELLATAIDAGFKEEQPLEDALAGYEQQRNRAAFPQYEETCRDAAFEPPRPEVLELRAALRRNQQDTDRFYGVELGTVPVAEFYAPENIERILGEARQ